MDLAILIAITCIVFLLLLGLGYYLRSRGDSKEPVKKQRAAAVQAPARPRNDDAALPRRAQMLRNRGARLRAQQQQHQQEAEAQQNESDEDDEEAQQQQQVPDIPDNVTKKKRAKLEAKAAKKAEREAEQQLREDKRKRQEEIASEKRKIEEEEELQEKLRLEEEEKERLEKERRDHEDYLRMKQAFIVEEQGFEETGDEGENKLEEFINYIKQQKVVVIEDLAARFNLKMQATIDRIRDLLNDDILTGVIDDRGKFIYVSMDEMEAIVKFVKQRGRVSIAELAESSSQLINLNPQTNVS